MKFQDFKSRRALRRAVGIKHSSIRRKERSFNYGYPQRREFEAYSFEDAGFIAIHKDFIREMLKTVRIKKIATFSIIPFVGEYEELVEPLRFNISWADYRFRDDDPHAPARQDISFYCNYEQLKQIQERVTAYCSDFPVVGA